MLHKDGCNGEDRREECLSYRLLHLWVGDQVDEAHNGVEGVGDGRHLGTLLLGAVRVLSELARQPLSSGRGQTFEPNGGDHAFRSVHGVPAQTGKLGRVFEENLLQR